MRVLVATTAITGHFRPLVPFADALRAAGHDVVVAAPESFAAVVKAAGFVHRPFADAPAEELEAIFVSLSGLSSDEGNAIVVREVMGRIDTRAALPGMEAVIREWQPELILRETSEFSSYIVATNTGIPHVQVAAGLAFFDQLGFSLLEEPLGELGADPGLAALRSALRLSLVPKCLDDAPMPDIDVRRFRYPSEGTGDRLPDWWSGSPDPLLYITFGSGAGRPGLFPGFYQAVLAAVGDLPVRVLLTIGDAGDPDVLRPAPANVHVERWLPQEAVMPHAAAMVGHGGTGTTLLGLASAVPMVVIPLFAEHPHNARRVESVGAGIALQDGEATVEGLTEAVRRILDEESYRVAATRIAEEMARLPWPTEAVPLLEEAAGQVG